MTTMEKIENLTDEQIALLSTINDEAGLNEFFESNSIELDDEQKALLLDYLKTGKLELSDEQLDTVAGGIAKVIVIAITELFKKS